MKQRNVIIWLVFLILPFVTGFGEVSRDAIHTSLINLIATPEKYQGEKVLVTGVCDFEYEGSYIFLSKEHLLNGVVKNALSISLNYKAIGKTREELKKYNGQYVLMVGVFNKNSEDKSDFTSGSLENITGFMPMPLHKIK